MLVVPWRTLVQDSIEPTLGSLLLRQHPKIVVMKQGFQIVRGDEDAGGHITPLRWWQYLTKNILPRIPLDN